jgi:hypothetical protein
MAKAKGDLLAHVRSELAAKKTLTWVDRLPDDVRAEVDDIKARFIAGEFGNKATATWLSNTLAQSLQSRGFSVGQHSVQRWLKLR